MLKSNRAYGKNGVRAVLKKNLWNLVTRALAITITTLLTYEPLLLLLLCSVFFPASLSKSQIHNPWEKSWLGQQFEIQRGVPGTGHWRWPCNLSLKLGSIWEWTWGLIIITPSFIPGVTGLHWDCLSQTRRYARPTYTHWSASSLL